MKNKYNYTERQWLKQNIQKIIKEATPEQQKILGKCIGLIYYTDFLEEKMESIDKCLHI